MAGFYERYWEMSEGGPYDDERSSNNIFKCKDCGGETWHREGWDGEPDPGQCKGHCSSRASDWRPGRVSRAYRRNIDMVKMSADPLVETGEDVDPKVASIKTYRARLDVIFPDAPGFEF